MGLPRAQEWCWGLCLRLEVLIGFQVELGLPGFEIQGSLIVTLPLEQ